MAMKGTYSSKRLFCFAESWCQKGRNLFLVLIQVANAQLIKHGPGVSIKTVCGEMDRIKVVLDVCICILNHEDDSHLRRYVEALFIKVRDAKSLHH